MRATLLFFALLCGWVGPARAAAHYPSLAEAGASLDAGNIDDVYLSFGAIKAKQHPEGDKKLSALLQRGAKIAVEKSDWALAAGFATKARQLDPKNLDAWITEADAALQVHNGRQASEALDAAILLAPKNGTLLFRRARLAREQGQYDLALSLIKRIPASAPEAEQAKPLAAEIAEIQQQAREANEPPKPLPANKATRVGTGMPTVSAGADRDVVPAGYAARSSEHFRITYSEGQRDFAQKAGYEQQCLDLFERAWAKVHGSLGEGTAHPTEVVLYTQKEFEFHFGSRFSNGILGFYAGKIRMNRADKIDDTFFDTAVHEYTHAVIDSMSRGGQIPTWVHEGLARWVERTSAGKEPVDTEERRLLQSAQQQSAMPTLNQLAHRSFAEFSGPMITVAYEKSALAIDLLTRTGSGLVGLQRAIRGAKGGSFDGAFNSEFGSGRLAMLDVEVAKAIE